MKNTLIVILFVLLSSQIYSGDGKGPLWGKNYYVPFLPFYSFPGMKAAAGEKYDLNISLSQYYIQDIVTEFHLTGTDLIKERFIDYEGYIFEPTVSFNPLDTVEVGITSRIHFYYGGIFDAVFEGFHNLFSFPNGGRESYPLNDVYISLHTDSGIDLTLTDPAVSLGDTDLFFKWVFLNRGALGLSLFSAVKIPTGSMVTVSGSGYFDFAMALLTDLRISNRLILYIQNGLILPGQLLVKDIPSPEILYSLLVSLEFMPSSRVSLITQFRMVTSPIKEGATIPENISYSVKLHEPMTNIMAGVVLNLSGYRVQFSFEEDAFTNNGADLIFNITIGKRFNLAGIFTK